MAELSKLSMSKFAENHEMSSQKISFVSDQVRRAPYCGEIQSSSSSSFVVDIESFPTRSSDKELKTSSSRIIRSFSTKGSFRGCQKMTNLNHSAIESPRGLPYSPKTPLALVSVEDHVRSDHHHQVTITATDLEIRPHFRRLNSSIRRSHSAFSIDPRKLLFVFATLSSLGSLALIYFTLAIKKMNEESIRM